MAKKKALNEEQSRARLIGWARRHGCEAELLKIFSRYDDFLNGCKSKEEKEAVAIMGLTELHEFFAGKVGLITMKEKTIRDYSDKSTPKVTLK